jgi:HSP20 family protein
MRRFTEEMERGMPGFGPMTAWSPAIEVSALDGKVIVRADLPGLNKEDVKVEVTDGSLVIQGERKQEHEEHKQGFHRSERMYGSFYRSIPLPKGAQVDQARAQFNNGVLEVSIPVPAEQQQGRQIPVETGASERRQASSQTQGQQHASKAG